MNQALQTKLVFVADMAQATATIQRLKKEVASVTAATRIVDSGGEPFAPLIDGANEAHAALDKTSSQLSASATGLLAAAEKIGTVGARTQRTMKDAGGAAVKELKLTEQQLRMLGPQLTDIFVGLTTGQSPLMVLLQQGGQLKDVFGGVGNAARALATVFTPLRVALGAAAAVAGTFGLGLLEGARDSDALRKSLALTGNQAGVTVGYLDAVSQRLARTTTASIGTSREAVAQLVSTGAFAGSTLESAGRAAVNLSRLTGQSAAETIKGFAEMKDGVAAWAVKANESYAFLSAAQIEYVRTLEGQGRKQEAMRVVLAELSATMEQRSIPAIGALERGWIAVGNAVSSAWDALKGLGRDTTPEERIAKLRNELERLRQPLVTGAAAVGQRPRQQVEQELAALELLSNRDALRASERAISQKAEQEKAVRESKAYQDKVAAIELAGSQRRLAQELAALDAQQAATELAAARGIQTEETTQLALSRLEERRAKAQEAAVKRQIDIEKGRKVEKPEDQLDKDAAVAGLEAQLVGLQARVQQELAKRVTITATFALKASQELAGKWADAWKSAYDQVKKYLDLNATTDAARIADPKARADAEAQAKVATFKRQLDQERSSLQISIDITLDPERRALLQQQLDQLRAQGDRALGEQERLARQASLQGQAAELLDRTRNAEAALDAQVAAGAINFEDAETKKLALRREEMAQLEQLLVLLEALAQTPAEKNQVAELRNRAKVLADMRTEMEKLARDTAINSLSTALSDIVTGAKSGKQALLDMVGSFAKAMLDVLSKRLATKLVDQFLEAGKGLGDGGVLSSVGNFFAGLFHVGGHTSRPPAYRAISPVEAAAAITSGPRFHSGLRSDELLAVLKNDETVLTADQTRQVSRAMQRGGVTINAPITVTGTQGDDANTRRAAADLERRQRAMFDSWLTDQMRPGGILAGG